MKRIVTLLLLIGCISTLHAQEDAVIYSIVSNIAKQLLVFPQEKIYLQTDKPYYITGEKIFFRAFLLDAFSNRQDTLSRYVYVELINPADSVVQRVKIRKDSTFMFYGAIPLPEDLPQGAYTIRAYTRYMQNQGENSFFSKQVRISDPQILSVQTESNFQFPEAGKINASLRFADAKTQEVINPQSVSFRLNQEEAFTRKPDKDGWIRFQLKTPDEASQRTLYVELTGNSRIYKQYIPIPYPEGDLDVSFYPEGGHLIAGQSSNVAFKAVDTHGAAPDITGEVVDSKGNVVTQLKTIHDGMGEFFINPLLGEHYKAVMQVKGERDEVKGERLRVKEINLPEAQINALALKALILNDKLLITVNKPDSVSCSNLYLLIHSRGSIIYAKAYDTEKNNVVFNTSAFPSGVSHILLLTKDFCIVSERLVFLLSDDNGTATFRTQKDSYNKREKVQTEIQLKDENQKPLSGNFSIAVTNDKEVVIDTTSSILSGILLCSELRGHIDNPDYYFQKGNKEAETAADLLMKTHGWTRYAIPDVVRGKLCYPKIPFEQSQAISGIVKKGVFSKPVKDFKVSLISLNHGFTDLTETDETGRYVFGNFEFPDSTRYVIQALNKKGGGRQMTELFADEDTFPKAHTCWTIPLVLEEKTNPALLDYVAKADRQYTYQHGMRIINLPEVQIKGTRRSKDGYEGDRYTFSSEEIMKYGSSNIKKLLYRVPFVSGGADGDISVAGRTPVIIIDGLPLSVDFVTGTQNVTIKSGSAISFLNMVSLQEIRQIDVYKGAIAITTKRGIWNSGIPFFNIKPVMPLGYQLPIEFYSPKYDTQESINNSTPDLRTTIYWKPNVITDKDGNTKFDFYTADDPATYSVIIEGVSEDGKLIHYWGKAAITVNSDK